jgi:hypothetical protein
LGIQYTCRACYTPYQGLTAARDIKTAAVAAYTGIVSEFAVKDGDKAARGIEAAAVA